MSIIYDALQKIQHNNHPGKSDNVIQKRQRTPIRWRQIGLLIITFLPIMVIFFCYPFIFNKFTFASGNTSQNKKILVHANKLILNGVFISDKERLVEINNQFFHLGDTVGKMKVVGIEFSEITLESGKDTFKLQVPS